MRYFSDQSQDYIVYGYMEWGFRDRGSCGGNFTPGHPELGLLVSLVPG